MMVSVADEQGRLVLVGVDATYCVVDEVDTTSSLNDLFLQEAIDDADAKANVKVALATNGHKNGVDNRYVCSTIKKTPQNVIRTRDLLLRSKSGHKKPGTCTTKPSNTEQKPKNSKSVKHTLKTGAGSPADDQSASTHQAVPETTSTGSSSIPNSSLLRAVLLCQPVSLREPSASSGHLNFRQQEADCPGEDAADSDANPDENGTSEAEEEFQDDGDSVKRKTASPRKKLASPKKARPLKPLKQKPSQPPASGTAEDPGSAVCDKEEGGGREGEEEAVKPKPKRTREKPYQCGVCSRWFGCKSHVVEHMRTHTGEKPFQCTLCDKRFSQKSNIYQHMNTHTKERPFRCNDCGKDFMYRGSLYKHKRLHTGERPYTCGLCSRRFTHASQLFEHLRTHTNERPFKCGVCGRAFAHSGTMHRHQRNHFSQVKSGGSNNNNNNSSRGRKVKEVNLADGKEETERELEGEEECKDGVKGKELIEDINHNLEAYSPPYEGGVGTKGTGVASGDWADAGDERDEKSVCTEDRQDVHDLSNNNNIKVISVKTSQALDKTIKVTSVEGADLLNNNSLISVETASDLTGSVGVVNTESDSIVSDGKAKRSLVSSAQQTESYNGNTDTAADTSQSKPQGISTHDGASSQSAPTRKAKISQKSPPTSKRKSKDPIEEASAATGKKTKRTRIETPDRKVFSCNLCGHSFCHKRSVKRHKQAVHPHAADDNVVVVAKVAGASGGRSPEKKSEENEEEEEESKEELRSRLTNNSLLKSLLTMTRTAAYAHPNTAGGPGSQVFPDLAALGVRPLGEASANLHAFAQLCSQESENLGSSSVLTHHGAARSPSTENSLPTLRVKVELQSEEQLTRSLDTAEEGLDGDLPTCDVAAAAVAATAAAMQRVVVKTEPVDPDGTG